MVATNRYLKPLFMWAVHLSSPASGLDCLRAVWRPDHQGRKIRRDAHRLEAEASISMVVSRKSLTFPQQTLPFPPHAERIG
jgi:hypothetical protein